MFVCTGVLPFWDVSINNETAGFGKYGGVYGCNMQLGETILTCW